MSRETPCVIQSFRSGLWQIFRSSPILAFCSFLLILSILSIIPLAFLWLFQCLFFNISFLYIPSPFLRVIITLWSIVEVLFFFYQCYLYIHIQRQHAAPALTKNERDQLVSYALANIKDLRTTLSKWFLDRSFHEIDRHSVSAWLAFAFYSKHHHQLDDHEHEQIDSFIEKIEISHQLKALKNNSKEKIAYMKHILDPVRVIFRPFIFYVVTDTILDKVIGRSVFFFRKYQFVQISHLQLWTYYHPTVDKDQEEDPIIFFHGIGAGLLFYQPLISYLHKKFSHNRRLIFISMPCVGLRYPSLNNIPNMLETTTSMKFIFDHYQINKAVFMGHSYGTACLSWIVQKCPEYISKLIFLDPICFALFEPYVVYNFIYRNPNKLMQLYMYYFVCRELGISYVVSRHFWWTQNNLYLEQIRSCSEQKLPIFVLLAARDCIVNAHVVRDYLIDNQIDFYWAPKLFHAGCIYNHECWERISQWISPDLNSH